jgi:hypothetical protein
MGEDLGSAIMGEANEGLGVMNGKVPATPVKTPSKAPYKPEVRAAIEAQYDAATPQERKNLESAPGALGDVARQRAQEYAKEKEATRKVSPRVEARTERLIEAGEKPEFARAAAQRATEQGVAPGQEVAAMQREGTLDKTDFDFEMQKQYKDANTLVRGAMAGYQGYKQGALGVNQAVADLVGADEFARTQGLGAAEARNAVQAMGENPNYIGRMFEGAISSIAQQLPAMTAGAISGSEAVVLGSMIAQSFGQEYAEGRAKGLDGLDAATRAGLMASFEGLGEKFGLKFAMDNIRRATSGMQTSQLKEFLGNTLKKELPGEYLTTTGQFLTDLSSVGLNKNATLGDYLQQMADTTVQTLMQSGLMTGGTKALEKGVAALGGKKETGAEQIERLRQELGIAKRPELTDLQGARKPELEVEKGQEDRAPLTKMEAARNPELEVNAPPAAPPAPPADPRKDALVKSYVEKGFMQDDAELMANQELAALTTPPDVVIQQAKQKEAAAVATAMQSLGGQNATTPNAEPPSYVTQPSTDQFGAGVPSTASETAGRTSSPITNGLAAAERLVGAVTNREERERAALEQQHKQVANRLARAFNQQAFPDLAPIFGTAWQQQARAENPTPEQFQEAAYAKLEELNFLGQRAQGAVEPTPVKPKVEEAKPVEEKPTVYHRTTEPFEGQFKNLKNKLGVSFAGSRGFYFSKDLNDPDAQIFGKHVIPAKVDVKNPAPIYQINFGTSSAPRAVVPVDSEWLANNPEAPRKGGIVVANSFQDVLSGNTVKRPSEFTDYENQVAEAANTGKLFKLINPEQLQDADVALLESQGFDGFDYERPADSQSSMPSQVVAFRPEQITRVEEETPSVAETTEAKQAKEERPEAPAAKPAAPTIEEQEAEAIKKEDEELAKLEATKKRIREIVYGNTASAIDDAEAGVYKSWDEASDIYHDNVYETLGEEGIKDDFSKRYASDLFLAEIEKAKKSATKPTGAKPLAPAEFAPLELEAGRNEELEVEETNKALLNIDEHMKKVYGTTATGELRKRATGAGRPESETAKTEEERKQESKEANQFNRDVQTLLNVAGKYGERQELTAFKTKEEWEAAEEVRANNLALVREALYGVSRQPGTAKGVIAAKDYIRNLKPAEREAAQKAHESARKSFLKPMEAKGRTEYIAEQQFDMEPDLAFYSVDTAKGALAQIVDSPNEIESLFAARLLQRDNIKSLENVDFIVVDKTTKIKDKVVKRMLDKGTIGVFVSDTVGGTIYVRGDSYDEQGINNEIVLHEAMHASGSKKIAFATLAKEQGEPISNNLAEAVDDLQALMERAKAAYDSKGDNISPMLKFLHDKGGAFTDIQEFYAYGLTNADMKEFLLNEVQGKIDKTSGFDDFINVLLRLFGIDPKIKSGLKDLVLISHEVMKAKEPEGAKLAAMSAKANADLINEAKAKETEAEALERKIAASKTPDEILDATSSLIGVAKNPKLIGKALGRIWKNITAPKKESLLAVLPTNVLIEIGTEAGIGNLKQIDRDVQQMATFRNKSMMRMEKIANEWIKLGNKTSKKLAEVMHRSTLAQIDPSKNTSDPKLNALWRALPPKAKDIYVRARDFYAENYKLYLALLDQRLEASGVKGDINDPQSDKGRLATAIRAEYEGKAKFAPYFPLMRYGDYWVSIGKGEKREFYMFENEGDRDLFLDESTASRYKGITKEKLLANKDIDFGNDVARLREAAAHESSALKKMFELIDSMSSADAAEKARLRDEVFQMHLLTLPDSSFRNMFLHRKETAGFSGDALRNFITTGTKFAGQLSRIKYGPKLQNSVSAAYSSLEGNPDKGKLENIVKEIKLRVDDQINPPFTESAFDSFVRFANKFAFMYALTTAKSALNNTFGLATNTVWTLAKYHGLGAATTEMAKFLNPISRQVGIAKINSKGNLEYTFPSVASSKIVRNSKELQRAMQAFEDSGMAQHTQTFDVWLAKKGKSVGAVGTAFEAGVRVTGALFQGSERMTREVAYLSAFQLARKKMSFEDAVNQAIDIVNESLFDYSTWNAPRIIRSPGARLITQFKKFSLYTTSYYMRNAYQMIKPLQGESRRGAMYAFFGSMLTTGLLAGVTKAFGVSAMMSIWGMAQALYNRLLDDEPDEDPLKTLDIVRWYNNVYLPEWCGDVKFAGMPVSDILSSGILTAATGYDLSSGISLDNLWFKDIPSAGHWDNAIMDLAEKSGPFMSIASTMLSSAKDFAEGDNKKGFEKLIPAAMLRAPAVAYRYATEGALTKNLDELKAADEFTAAQLFMQGLGFKTSGLSEVTDTNYFISQATREIEALRSDLIRRRLKAEDRDDDNLLDKIDEEMDRFEHMYPHPDLQITDEDLEQARKTREKRAEKTERGLAVEEKFSDYDVLRDKAIEKIEAEAK